MTAAAPGDDRLTVREMSLSEVPLRIDYFHDATDEHLQKLGVDRTLLPARSAWRDFYEQDYARPLPERENYTLVWLRGGSVVGFSSTDHITFGDHAFMHLHIIESGDRHAGLGAPFVRLSARAYFRDLQLTVLYCQPNAFNVAPNRTLQRAGFRYVCTEHLQPSAINYPQPVTRWALERPTDLA